MSIEQRPEITSFINNWANKPREQVAEELASYSMETKRIPDLYYFTIDSDGDLFHPQAQTKVRNLIRRDTSVGEMEGQAFDAISSWFRQSDRGVIAWVSPPHHGIYPTSKIVISEIEGEGKEKKLSNRAIILDFDQTKCLDFVRQLAAFSKNHPLFQHLDQIRSTPLILNTNGRSWIYILQELIDDPVLWRSIREGGDKKAKEAAIIQASVVYQSLFKDTVGPSEGQNMIMRMLGERVGSCPVVFAKTGFRLFADSASLLGVSTSLGGTSGEYHVGSCAKCGSSNVLVGGCQICTTCEKDMS